MVNKDQRDDFKPDRIGRLGKRLVAGVDGDYDMETRIAIPTQWANYNAMGYPEDGMVSDEYYGVSHDIKADGQFGYLCGMQLKKDATVPLGLTTQTIPAGNYAKFRIKENISTIGHKMNRAMNEWLPNSGYEKADGPVVEFYGSEFDSRTGDGGFEIWIPVRKTGE